MKSPTRAEFGEESPCGRRAPLASQRGHGALLLGSQPGANAYGRAVCPAVLEAANVAGRRGLPGRGRPSTSGGRQSK